MKSKELRKSILSFGGVLAIVFTASQGLAEQSYEEELLSPTLGVTVCCEYKNPEHGHAVITYLITEETFAEAKAKCKDEDGKQAKIVHIGNCR